MMANKGVFPANIIQVHRTVTSRRCSFNSKQVGLGFKDHHHGYTNEHGDINQHVWVSDSDRVQIATYSLGSGSWPSRALLGFGSVPLRH